MTTQYLLPKETFQALLKYLSRCPCGDVINLVLALNQLEKTEVEEPEKITQVRNRLGGVDPREIHKKEVT